MVVVNFVDPAVMGKMPEEEIREMFAKLFAIWQPLSTEWFTLANCVSLVYLERSLNEASTVVAPPPGQQPKAFPKDNESAQLLMDGLFWASPEGDIFLNEECYNRRLEDPGHAMWKAFRAEVILSLFSSVTPPLVLPLCLSYRPFSPSPLPHSSLHLAFFLPLLFLTRVWGLW